jgi:hypothetical protein
MAGPVFSGGDAERQLITQERSKSDASNDRLASLALLRAMLLGSSLDV